MDSIIIIIIIVVVVVIIIIINETVCLIMLTLKTVAELPCAIISYCVIPKYSQSLTSCMM